MFDFDAGKMIIVGVIALVFIPPKDLPRVLRQVGQFVGKMRRMAAEFQGQFMDAMREADLADLKREAQKLSDAARSSSGFDSLHQLDGEMTGALGRSGALAPQAVAPATVQAEAPAALPMAAAPAEASVAEPAPAENAPEPGAEAIRLAEMARGEHGPAASGHLEDASAHQPA